MNTKLVCYVAVSILFATSSVRAGVDLVVSGVPHDAPIAIKASSTATDLIVDIVLEPEWHVYSRDVGGGQPVSLTTDSSSSIVATGEMQLPNSDSGKLTETVRVRLPIGRGRNGNPARSDATLRIQVCDALMCQPPMDVKITGEVPSLRVLLVVGVQDERTTRIEEWLNSYGFEVSTETYANVEADDCESHDVVLADSNVFRKTTATRADIHKFPKTKTPLVAVGFNGTELIESHKIAMTSGYI